MKECNICYKETDENSRYCQHCGGAIRLSNSNVKYNKEGNKNIKTTCISHGKILLLSLFVIASTIFFTRHGFINLRQGDDDTAIMGLVSMFFLNTIFISIIPTNKKKARLEILIKLVSAIAFNSIAIVILLSTYQIPINRLYSAINSGNYKHVERILKKYPLYDIDGYSDKYLTVNSLKSGMSRSIESNRWDLFTLLKEYLEMSKYDISNLYDQAFETVVMLGSVEGYNLLIDKGSHPNSPGKLLQKAIAFRSMENLQMMELLLKNNLGANTPLETMFAIDSPPIHAIVKTSKEFKDVDNSYILLLMEYGGDINLVDHRGYTPIMYTKSQKVKDNLIILGAINISFNVYGESELHEAIREGDRERIKKTINSNPLLLEVGTDNGSRPLHMACSYYSDYLDLYTIRFLLESGANPNVLNDFGYSPLLVLPWKRYEVLDPVKVLYKHGANLDHTVSNYNAMIFSQTYGYSDTIRFLQKKRSNK